MKLKLYSLFSLCAGMLLSALGFILPFIALQNHSGDGIVGGADAPTYEFLILNSMNGLPLCIIVLGIILIISALFCLIFSKTVKNNCNIKTTVLSLGLSAVGAAGLVCAFLWFTIVSFGEMSKHPIEYPTSVLIGFLCFFAFIVLIAIYFKVRKTNWSIKGVIIDVLTSIIYLPTFFFGFSYLYQLIA